MRPTWQAEQEIEVRAPVQGLTDTPQRDLLPKEAAIRSVNVHHDSLSIRRRQGRAEIGVRLTTHQNGRCIYQFRKRDGSEELLSVRDEYLYKWDSVTNLWKGAVSGASVAGATDLIGNNVGLGQFVQHADRLYYWDGGTERKYYEADTPAIHDWGFQGGAIPAGSMGGVRAGGNMLPGDYTFVYTYYNPTTGHETDPAPESDTFSAPNPVFNSRYIDIPANGNWDSDYSTVRIYRSIVNGVGGIMYFEIELTGVTSLPLTGGVGGGEEPTLYVSFLDSLLGAAVATDNAPPEKLLYATLYNDQVVAVEADNDSSLVWSKSENPNSWPPVNQKYIERDAGDPNASLFVMLGQLYLIKAYEGVWALLPSAGAGFIKQKITSDVGSVGQFSVVVAGTMAYWLEPRGVIEFDGQNVRNVSDKKIRQTFKRFGEDALFHNAYGVRVAQADRQYVRWLVQDSTEGIVYHLVYDLSREAFFLDRPGPQSATPSAGAHDRCAAVIVEGSQRHIYTLTSDGYCFRLYTDKDGNDVWDDNGSIFLFSWQSPWFGNGIDSVLPLYIDIELERSVTGLKDGPFVIKFMRDGSMHLPFSQLVSLFDDTSTFEGSKSIRVNLDRGLCRRFSVYFQLSGDDSDLQILKYRIKYRPWALRVRGI